MSRSLFWRVAPLMALTTALSACDKSAAPAAESAVSVGALAAPGWSTTPAKSADKVAWLKLPARLVLSPQQQGRLHAPLSGLLVRWEVSPGQQVEAGQLLATLRSGELEQLDAERSNAQRLNTQRARLVQLREEQRSAGVATQADQAQAKLEQEQAQAQLYALDRRYRDLQAQGLKPLGRGLWGWHSTLNGTLSELRCSPGQRLELGQSCGQLIANDALKVRAAVPATIWAEQAQIPTGQWRANDAESPVDVKVAFIAQQIDAQTDTLAVYFEGALPPSTLANTPGELTLMSAPPQGAVILPRSSLTLLDGKPHVFAQLEGNDKPQALPIELLRDQGDTILARHPKLSVGGAVVERGVFSLKSQQLLAQEP